MANEGHLLRMLEPAVRPVPVAHRTTGTERLVHPPIESRSFEQLLSEIQALTPGGTEPGSPSHAQDLQTTPSPRQHSRWLADLEQADRLENDSLRHLLAHQGRAASRQVSTDTPLTSNEI